MDGSHRRGGGRAPSPQQAAESSPLDGATVASSEVTIGERPSKHTCHASGSTSSLSSGAHHGFADLLDSLLHEIIALFNSIHDFLAFIGTCRSWRAAASTFPSESVYTLSFPPLHLKPVGPYFRPHRGNIKPLLLSDCIWQLSDPSKENISLRCVVPQNNGPADTVHYLGCSYGYLIFSYEERCLLVNVLTGAKVEPPKLPPNNNLGNLCGIGILTAALSSPNTRLLICARTSMFEWQVGTDSWSEHPLPPAPCRELIHQIVVFNGHIFAIDDLRNLHTIHLAPRFSMQLAAIVREFDSSTLWLVVSGDKLLMLVLSFTSDGSSGIFEVSRLDCSVEPAKWVKVDKLENEALFVSLDPRNPTFACTRPERWGGKSNCIYVAKLFVDPHETWTAVELGQPVQRNIRHCSAFPPDCRRLSSLWVLPSLIYGSGY